MSARGRYLWCSRDVNLLRKQVRAGGVQRSRFVGTGVSGHRCETDRAAWWVNATNFNARVAGNSGYVRALADCDKFKAEMRKAYVPTNGTVCSTHEVLAYDF